ncbi:hypothetical protein M3J07_012079 [Ascochyta lentis]
MLLRSFQYTNDKGVLCSVDVPETLQPYAAEHLMALENLITRVNGFVIQDVPISSQGPQTKVKDGPSGLLDNHISADAHTSTGKNGYIDPLNGFSAEELKFLYYRRWEENGITSAEEVFLLEHGLGEADYVVYDSSSAASEAAASEVAASEAAPVPEQVLAHSHEHGCKCSFPWNCKSKPEPRPVFSDASFGPVGSGRPTPRKTAKSIITSAPSSSRSAAVSPVQAPTSTTPSQAPPQPRFATRRSYLAAVERFWQEREDEVTVAEEDVTEALEQAILVEETDQAVDRYQIRRAHQIREQYSFEVIRYEENSTVFRVEGDVLRRPRRYAHPLCKENFFKILIHPSGIACRAGLRVASEYCVGLLGLLGVLLWVRCD